MYRVYAFTKKGRPGHIIEQCSGITCPVDVARFADRLQKAFGTVATIVVEKCSVTTAKQLFV